MKKIFLNCNLILPDRILEDGALCAENGRIEWIGRREAAVSYPMIWRSM